MSCRTLYCPPQLEARLSNSLELFDLDKAGLRAELENGVRLQLAELHSAIGAKAGEAQVKVRGYLLSRCLFSGDFSFKLISRCWLVLGSSSSSAQRMLGAKAGEAQVKVRGRVYVPEMIAVACLF